VVFSSIPLYMILIRVLDAQAGDRGAVAGRADRAAGRIRALREQVEPVVAGNRPRQWTSVDGIADEKQVWGRRGADGVGHVPDRAVADEVDLARRR